MCSRGATPAPRWGAGGVVVCRKCGVGVGSDEAECLLSGLNVALVTCDIINHLLMVLGGDPRLGGLEFGPGGGQEAPSRAPLAVVVADLLEILILVALRGRRLIVGECGQLLGQVELVPLAVDQSGELLLVAQTPLVALR